MHALVCKQDKGEEARAVLLDSHHPRRFYPFAATGINITRSSADHLEAHLSLRTFQATIGSRRVARQGATHRC